MKIDLFVLAGLSLYLTGLTVCAEAQDLKITVTQGGGVNVIRDGSAITPMVKVEDSGGKPVAGAAILFEAPESGPSVTFGGTERRATATTDSSGLAQAPTPRPNNLPGEFEITVFASYNGLFKSVTVAQRNVPGQTPEPSPKPSPVPVPPAPKPTPPPPPPFARKMAGEWQFIAPPGTRPPKGSFHFEQQIDLTIEEAEGLVIGKAKVSVAWPGRAFVPERDKQISFDFLGKVSTAQPTFPWTDKTGEVSFEIRDDGTLIMRWQRTTQNVHVASGGQPLHRLGK